MTLLEAERTQRRKKQSRRRQYAPPLDKPLSAYHPDQVLLFCEWCELNRISERTGRRIIARGEVEVTQLTPKRIGVTIRNNAKWQRSRGRG